MCPLLQLGLWEEGIIPKGFTQIILQTAAFELPFSSLRSTRGYPPSPLPGLEAVGSPSFGWPRFHEKANMKGDLFFAAPDWLRNQYGL